MNTSNGPGFVSKVLGEPREGIKAKVQLGTELYQFVNLESSKGPKFFPQTNELRASELMNCGVWMSGKMEIKVALEKCNLAVTGPRSVSEN